MEGNMGNFLQQNPRFFVILMLIAGIGLFIYTLNTDAKDLLAKTVNRWGQHDSIFGEKFEAVKIKALFFVLSVILIFVGILFIGSWIISWLKK
jgi:hypothetical protein